LSLQTLSSDERRRRAPFLTVLGTHCISRSFPLPPQRMPASPAAASAAPGPAPHSHPAAFKRRRQSNTTCARSMLCGRPRSRVCPPASHAGRGDTLEAPCCLTCRRRRAKHRLREREAVPQRQAVPIVAPSTRAPPPSATALLLEKLEPLYPPCCPLSRRPPRRPWRRPLRPRPAVAADTGVA